jgi:outer membrane protein
MLQRALLSVLLSALLFVPVAARAATAPTIAIVDVEKILGDAKAAKSLQKQIQTKKEAFQKEFSAKEKELKSTETSLLAEQGKITAEEFGKQRKAYEEKILETRKLFQKRRNSLDQGLNKAMGELRKNIVEAAAKVADEKGYDIVLTRESVLIADKALDITTDVLTALDTKLADIQLKVE